MSTRRKPTVPISGVIYGEIIYWITCMSALVVLIGTIKSFMETDAPIEVSYLMSAILAGDSVETIWLNSSLKMVPNTSTYIALSHSGESLTVLGIALGIFSVIPAVFCSAAFLWRSRNPVFAVSAILSGIISVVALTGLVSLT